jgi:hypothetical protein
MQADRAGHLESRTIKKASGLASWPRFTLREQVHAQAAR